MASVMVYNRTSAAKTYIRKGHVIKVPARAGALMSLSAAEEMMEREEGLSFLPPHVGEPGEPDVFRRSVELDAQTRAIIEASGVQQLTGMLRLLVPGVNEIKGVSGGAAPKGLGRDDLAHAVTAAMDGRHDEALEYVRARLEGDASPAAAGGGDAGQ